MSSKPLLSRAFLAAALLICTGHPSQAGDDLPAADAALAAIPAFRHLFGGERGLRPVHTKGTLVEGVFFPSADAETLSRAPQFTGGPVPTLVRFSNFMGLPSNPDAGPFAAPYGMAIKFKLGSYDTDLVANSFNGFPAATPDAFVGFLQALADGNGASASGQGALDSFLATHPAARTFVDTPKPAPLSWATEQFYGVNAFGFVDAEDRVRFGRYVIIPSAGAAWLSKPEASAAGPDYLATELSERLAHAPVEWRIAVQLAAEGDQTADGSRPWPNTRPVVTLGTLRLTGIVAASAETTRSLLFNPLNLVDGIIPSDDPMLAARSRAYGASYRERMH